MSARVRFAPHLSAPSCFEHRVGANKDPCMCVLTSDFCFAVLLTVRHSFQQFVLVQLQLRVALAKCSGVKVVNADHNAV